MNMIGKWNPPVLIMSRLALGCLFLVSGLSKMRQPYDFLGDVYKYQLVGPVVAKSIAMILPWLEVLTGSSLVGGLFVGGGLVISACLALVFAFAQISALARGLPIACGCFGSLAATDLIGYASLIRLSLMLITSIVGIWAWLTIEFSSAQHDSQPRTKTLANVTLS